MSEFQKRKQELNGTEMLPEMGTNGGMGNPMGMQRAGGGGNPMGMQRAGGAMQGAMMPEQSGSVRSITLGTGAKKEFASRVTKERLAEANKILEMYKIGKTAHDQRVMENERYYRMCNWASKRMKMEQTDTNSRSGWLLNVIMNKHADAMDNIPELNVLPRAEDDKEDAQNLSAIIPCIFEMNDYEGVYDRCWTDKLVAGVGIKGIFWDSSKGGAGDIVIRRVDALNVFWEPGVEDIQDGRNFFCVAMQDIETLEETYPELKDKLTSAAFRPDRYQGEDMQSDADKACVIDWYYKRNGILHYCKYVGEHVLYASEDDENYRERGYYDHGLYPFVFDPMFTIKNSPSGLGYVDVCRDAQDYIDRLDSAILKSALANVEPRHFIQTGAVNEEEFLDPKQPLIHINGQLENAVQPLNKSELNALYVQVMNNKVNEMKETSGNRDFQQGGTASGVTAYSAIAALQEAGSKTSRDMIKAGYRAVQREGYMVLELIRQFYDETRYFRVTGNVGQDTYIGYSNQNIRPQSQGTVMGVELGERMPVFDIKISASKQNPFSKATQNELAKELYGMGLFNPQMADQALLVLDMMQFEGKDALRQKIAQNGTLLQMVQQLQVQVTQMAAVIDTQNGTQLSGAVAGQTAAQQQENPTLSEDTGNTPETDSLGNEKQQGRLIDKPRERAAAATAV